ncbi:MAG: DNA polymerase III subunit alpha [Bradymonadia bacterium]
MQPFVHLHVNTQYSLLKSAIRISDLIQRAQEMGMPAVAMTDTNNMFGAVEFYKKAKKAGIKPIFGTEVSVSLDPIAERPNRVSKLVLLARTNRGYENLRELLSMAWLDGLHDGEPFVDFSMLERYSDDVTALSGSIDNVIAKAIVEGRPDDAISWLERHQQVYGRENFFLEVISGGTDKHTEVNRGFLQLARDRDAQLVAANRCMYLDRNDARKHEVLLCIGAGRTLDDPYRPRFDTDSFWFKPGETILEQLGEAYATAVENTSRIAAACNVDLTLGEIYLPTYGVPEEHTIASYLVEMSQQGLERRYAEFEAVDKHVDKAVYQARLDEELGIIDSMGFPGYFLIVMDFIQWAKRQDIPVGPGRGSGAGSLVAYALEITDLDPIPYGLLFERFLNPERVSMPDFDIDFCMNRRGEVIDYVTQKYGEHNVGQIATFGGLKARGVIKDVGRVLGFSFGDRDRLSKLVPDVLGITLDQALEQEPRLRQMCDDDDRIRDLMEIARSLEGLYKSTGMHAAGVVIGDDPLWKYCPIFRGAAGEIVTQFAKDEVEEAGLVKFDFLGLKTLTVIEDAVKLVNRDRAPADHLDLTKELLKDPGVYKLISRGDTEGVFQLESSGFQELLKKLKPDKFEDIVAAVALYRPGPLNSGMLDDFIARKHGRQKISYPHPDLKDILIDTYGVIVYQEQVMQIAQVLAGFTLGAADLLRRAMGKKKAEVMAAQREEFAKGAKVKDIDRTKADEIFDLMEKFAQYGFNKSHSAAYALLTYHTAYLKAHHKVEFMAAVLTNDRDNADKVAKGIRSARKIGIEVLPPCVNLSGVDFDALDGKLLFGMGGIKGVGAASVEAIVEAREDGGNFESLFDFCERIDLKRINKKTMEALVKSGAFDSLEQPRARLMAAIDTAMERAQNAQRDRASGQANLFGMLASASEEESEDALPPELMRVEEWPEQVFLAHEKSTLGFYISGHPLDRFSHLIARYASTTIDSLGNHKNHDQVTLGGVQTSIRVVPFKKGDGRMAIIQFEDLTGSTEVIAMGQDFDRYEALLTSDEPVLLKGTLRIDRDEDRTKISVRLGAGRRRRNAPPASDEPDVISLQEVRATRSRGIELQVSADQLSEPNLERLADVLGQAQFNGQCQLKLRVQTPETHGDAVVTLASRSRVSPSDELSHAIKRIFNGRCELNIR